MPSHPKELAPLTLFPSTFTAEQAAHLFTPVTPVTPGAYAQATFLHDFESWSNADALESALTKFRDEWGSSNLLLHDDGSWEFEPNFRKELATKYPCSRQTRLKFIESCLFRIHACNEKRAQVHNFKEFLSWIASGQLPVEAISTGPWGLDLCAACDRMFPFLKYNHEAVVAFKLLLQHPHDPRCPFCVFHMYPVLHSLGLFKDMEDVLTIVPQRGYNSHNMMYGNYNVYLDYLTCLSYNKAIQRQYKEAEHNAREALQYCSEAAPKLNNANNLAFALRKQGRLEEAERLTREYMDKYLEAADVRISAEAHMTLGNILRAKGQLHDACHQQDLALQLAERIDHVNDVDDVSILVHYHAAKTFMRVHDPDRIAQAIVLLSDAKDTQESRFAGHPILEKMRAYLFESVVALFTFNSHQQEHSLGQATV